MVAPRRAARRRRGRRLTPRRRGAVRSLAFAALLGAGWLVGPGPAAGGAAGGPVAAKAAVTLRSAPMDTSHGPVPEQAPDQPVKAEPAAARAVRRTTAPALKPWRQSVGHQMPAGALSTEPVPVPAVAASR